METNRIVAKLYYIFSILYFLRKIKNRKEVMKNLFSLFSGHTNITVQLANGYKFKVRDMYDLLALKEVFDDEIYRFIFDGIKENTSLIDLGAYIGDTEVYAQKYRKVENIIALEPMPENFKLTQTNMRLNKLTNVRLYSVAVAKKKSKITLYIHPNKGQSGFWKKSSKVKKILVKTMTLSDVIKLVKTPNMILKCDCEGAEYEIFMHTATSTLAKFQKIVFEYHDNKQLLSIIKRLNKAGFEVSYNHHPIEKNLGTAYAA